MARYTESRVIKKKRFPDPHLITPERQLPGQDHVYPVKDEKRVG